MLLDVVAGEAEVERELCVSVGIRRSSGSRGCAQPVDVTSGHHLDFLRSGGSVGQRAQEVGPQIRDRESLLFADLVCGGNPSKAPCYALFDLFAIWLERARGRLVFRAHVHS